MTTFGWDIGGVNTKCAVVQDGRVRDVISRAFEIQIRPAGLRGLLTELAHLTGARGPCRHAVTMTAELSQAFRTKREGVGAVLDAVEGAFGASDVRVYAVDGRFLPVEAARRAPLLVAAANWAATARLVAETHPTALLIDVGTTSTDIVPIRGGGLDAVGWTDPGRLASGELVYTGAVRTPVEAMTPYVPYGDGVAGVAAEAFALAGDVYVWLGDISPAEYTAPTPDGRPATRVFAMERLARSLCADREMVDEAAVTRVAFAYADAQVARIAAAIAQVRAARPGIETAVVTGLGAFVAARAARAAGMTVEWLEASLGADAARCAPAAAVAWLLDREAARGSVPHGDVAPSPRRRAPDGVDIVVKVGGGLLASPSHLDAVLAVLRDAARGVRLLVVPGGGPFADAVRAVDASVHLSSEAAHWMAVLAMDQYACLLADRLPEASVIRSVEEMRGAFARGRLPVLAPSRLLRAEDPLPHSWDVTGDSIAAWVAGWVDAPRLVLVKPPGATGEAVVDAVFAQSLPAAVSARCVAGDDLSAMRLALGPAPAPPGA